VVFLAIGIATGIMVVAMHFYSQSYHLRGQLIDEAERLSAVRLVMERIASDLHAAFEQPQVGFTGSTDSMEFVSTRMSVGSGAGSAAGARMVAPSTDLRRVYYYLTAALAGTNFMITGLDRTEESLVARPSPARSTGSALSSTTTTSDASLVAPGPAVGATNATALPSEPMAEAIRFARFRFWDGTAWLEAWDSPGLPMAVEISLGLEPLPENDLPDAYPYELFRRIVVLPGRAPVDDWWVSL